MTLPDPSLGMSPAEHLRARIAAAPKQRLGRRRYGAELKHAVVEYAFLRKDEGATIREIAEVLGLSAGVLGRWLRRARLRLQRGGGTVRARRVAVDARATRAGCRASAAGSCSSQTVPSDAVRGSAPCGGETRRQVSTPQPIVIPATTLAEFLARAVASHGSIRRAADGIGVPYSTLRGWLQGRGGDAGDHGNAFLDALTALRGDLNATEQHLTALLDDVNAMSQRLDALERMLGFESDARKASLTHRSALAARRFGKSTSVGQMV
jgi:transposase-like protein